ncbi:MAG: hypothetical protein AAGL17_10375, partial [Cyanobacteria bacterium J06576_12]
WNEIWREQGEPRQAAAPGLRADDTNERMVANVTLSLEQRRCNTKEEPTAAPATPQGEPANDIPNLDPSVNPPTPAPQPTPAQAPPSNETAPPEATPEETVPDISQPSAPASSTSPIPRRQASPPPADPSEDPTNVTPTSEPPSPFDGLTVPTLGTLPDGVYRYLSGNYEYGVYSNEQLRANGGSLFLLTKVGDEVVGNFYPSFDEPGICIDGTVSGNSISGEAYPFGTSADVSNAEDSDTEETATSEVGESFVPFLGFTNLQVRQPRQVGEFTYYADALLSISEYSRINAGTSLAPTECNVPAAVSLSKKK